MLVSLSDRPDAIDRPSQSVREGFRGAADKARPLEAVRRRLAAAGWRALIQGKGSKDKPRLFWSFLRPRHGAMHKYLLTYGN